MNVFVVSISISNSKLILRNLFVGVPISAIFVYVICMLCFVTTPGLKTGVENNIFWSKIWSGFGEEGCTMSPRIP